MGGKINEILIKEEKLLRQKARHKAATFLSHEGIIIPDRSVVEQASGHLTAEYVASLSDNNELVADLTGGLGVNSYFFSLKAEKVFSIEKDKERARILENNFKTAGCGNIEVINQDCKEWINKSKLFFNTVFIDPSRRDEGGNRFPGIAESSPNVLEMIPQLLKKSDKIFIKLSPLTDVKEIVRLIPQTSDIHIIEVNHEVKEVLVEINKLKLSEGKPIKLHCIIFSKTEFYKDYSISLSDRHGVEYIKNANQIKPECYIYEPSPALMKLSMFNPIDTMFPDLRKLSANTQLYFDESLIPDFPGRIFKFERICKGKDLNKFKGCPINVISRNHPAKSKELEKKYKFIPSGNKYLMACTVGKEKLFLLSEII